MLRQLHKRTVQGAGKPVVLIACGSFSPVTFMHLRLFGNLSRHLRRPM